MSPSPPKSSAPLANLSDPATLYALLDSPVTPIFAVDPGGRVMFGNKALFDLLGVAPEAVLGKTVAELVEVMGEALSNSAAFLERVTALLAKPEEVSMAGVEYQTDRRFYFKEISQPIRHPDGTFSGRLFIYLDLTREREIDQNKTEFISIASHELRTPMTSIKGSLDLLLGGFAGDLSAEIRELLVIAQSGCDRLIRLINDVLDLSKIEAGRMQLRLQPMSLADSIQRSVRTIKAYADGFQVKLAVDSPGPLPEALGDRDRIDQVVTNLLGNAVKFSPSGSTVTIALRPAGDAVECRVIDQGPGIPADQLNRIFGKFQQVEGQPTKKGGTGLGLAIAKALVQEHGGRIWVESEVGRGCQFIFQIPQARRDS
ncbi:MAG: PAS domain-containing protein [Acidobacteria bacterium]|nr:PAS domain-containing protein [Acidobacteriota bacterium]